MDKNLADQGVRLLLLADVLLLIRDRLETETCVSLPASVSITAFRVPLARLCDENQVRSTVMTYEPFHCTFVGDSRGFQVTPEEGTLNRRGGDPQELDVSYKGNVSRVHCVSGSKYVCDRKTSVCCITFLSAARYPWIGDRS